MKKRILILSLLFAGLVLPVALVSSQNNKIVNKADLPSIAGKKTQLRVEAEKRAEQLTEKIKQVRQQVEEKLKEKSEKLKQKLAQIQDKKKQKMAEQIADQFKHINQVWTDHFSNLLKRYDNILAKIQIRSEKAAASGKDITAVNAAIQAAKNTIASARAAVETQAKKMYAVDIIKLSIETATTTPSEVQITQKLRLEFKALRGQLFKDLFALRDGLMKDVRSAVQNALQALSKVPKVDEEPSKEATTTPSNQ